MLVNEIVNKFLNARKNLLLECNSNVWFEIHICENYKTHCSKTHYKFYKIECEKNKLILKNKHSKIIKILTNENTEWISCITLCDKHMKVNLISYNFVEIDKEE